MDAVTLNLTLNFSLPTDVESGQMEVSKMFEPKKENAEAGNKPKRRYPKLAIDESKFAVVDTATDDGRSVWPAEDYFEGDDVYDGLYPRG